MIDLNRELILDELSNFEKQKSGEITDILNKYLESVAQNGDTMFSWHKLQPLLRRKLEVVMNEFNELCPTDHLIPLPNVKPFDFDELKAQILEAIDSFGSAPFTIQRLCELLTNPSKHYKRTDKFMRGIEKNILVVTTIEPKSANGSNTHYSTSSFKNLFSALHSTSNSCHSTGSMASSSTSLLVNGISEVICDNQMSSLSPVSPSPTSTSSTQHLPPLQQLDSFTTVFASSSPSTPLSVVSDLHTYDHSSSLSLMSSTTSGGIPLSSTTTDVKTIETCAELDSSSNPQIDSTDVSSSSASLKAITSTDIDSEIKTELTQNILDPESEPELPVESNRTVSSSDINTDFSETTVNSNENKEVDKELIKEEEESIGIDNKDITLSESSLESKDIKNSETNESESICAKTDITSKDAISCDNELNEEKSLQSLSSEVSNGTETKEMIESLDTISEMRATNEEDMSQPMDSMDFCGSNVNSDMTDINERNSDSTPDCNIMDETLSQSDQSEPMDED